MFGLPPGAVEWLASGAVLVALGALIRFGGWTFLIAGYDESSPVPKHVAASLVGNTVLRLGAAVFAFGVLAAVTTLPEYAGAVLGVAIVLAVVRMLYRLNTYTPDAAEA
jgi:hypothetical protein